MRAITPLQQPSRASHVNTKIVYIRGSSEARRSYRTLNEVDASLGLVLGQVRLANRRQLDATVDLVQR